jgi:hypothetical protein
VDQAAGTLVDGLRVELAAELVRLPPGAGVGPQVEGGQRAARLVGGEEAVPEGGDTDRPDPLPAPRPGLVEEAVDGAADEAQEAARIGLIGPVPGDLRLIRQVDLDPGDLARPGVEEEGANGRGADVQRAHESVRQPCSV